MTHWLLTNPYWVAAQGVIQNSTVLFWAAAGFGLGKLHRRIGEHHELLKRLERLHRSGE